VNVKSIGRKALTPALGKTRLQPFFEALYEISLAGQNLGEGAHPDQSGERHVLQMLRERFEPPVAIFDVGAHVGGYTRAVLEMFNGTAQVWAFEPNPANFTKLKANLPGLRCYELALGDRPGLAPLYAPGGRAKGASLYDTTARMERVGTHIEAEPQVEVQTVDGFCEAHGIDRIHLLKLDVEGHELKVIQGAAGMIERGRIDAIQFEFANVNVYSRTFFKDFWDLLNDRYLIHRVLQDGLRPIETYTESCEVFKRATNYLALLR
jgi:FkbM family methyltransferase